MWKKVLKIIGWITLIGLLCLPLGFLGTWFYFGHQLKYLHLSKHLAGFLSLAFTLAFILGLKRLFSFRSRTRLQGKIILATTIGIWLLINGVAWQKINFYPDGTSAKWYADTPDGIRFFDSPGYDPVWNVKLQPVDPETLLRIKRRQDGPSLCRINPSYTSAFFDSETGKPLKYFSRQSDGCIAVFNRDGYDPRTGERLLPCTPEIVREIYAQLENPNCQHDLNELFVQGKIPLDVREFENYIGLTKVLEEKR